eukprot:5903838-Prymnesium_polylepis.1
MVSRWWRGVVHWWLRVCQAASSAWPRENAISLSRGRRRAPYEERVRAATRWPSTHATCSGVTPSSIA